MSKIDNKPVFKLIKGGLLEKASDSPKEFVSATVTDTRLMGVVGMHIEWYLPKNTNKTHLHQFFYFDAEESGFDTYRSVIGSGIPGEATEVLDVENSLLGGLGGKNVPVTEKEARYILQSYVEFNKRNNLPLPHSFEEYGFMLNPAVNLSDEEEYALMCKQCPSLDSHYQIINYFLMRCYGKDFGAAKFLTKGYVRTNLFPEHKAATLLRNGIEEAPDSTSGTNTNYYPTGQDRNFETFQTLKSYMCESLIEYDGKYFLLITQVTVDHLKIVKYEKVSSFRVSTSEASMMTKKKEYVTVTDIIPGAPQFDRGTTQMTNKAMITDRENGRLFMIFYPHNDHVKNQTFMLNDDVLGVYYVVDDSQLILSSNSLEGIQTLERDLANSPMEEDIVPISKYEFKEPVLFDFINSGFEDFEDFVVMIARPDGR